MFTHGIISSSLFAIIGFFYNRYHTRVLYYLTGLKFAFPIFSSFFFISLLGNLGMPGTGGFISEFLIFIGVLNKNLFVGFFSLMAPFFGAIFSLLLFLRIFYGTPFKFLFYFNPFKKFFFQVNPILTFEFYICFYFLFFIFYSGISPQTLLNIFYYNIFLIIY